MVKAFKNSSFSFGGDDFWDLGGCIKINLLISGYFLSFISFFSWYELYFANISNDYVFKGVVTIDPGLL